jgi:hypothetical protein
MRVKFLSGLKIYMNYLVTTLYKGNIGVYKKWLGHNMTVISE